MFIAIYGISAAGKSTLMAKLKSWLKSKGYKVLSTKEPTNGPIGSIIKGIVRKDIDFPRRGLLFLFIADRIWHEEKIIKPALEEGKIVICERYYLDTLVYHQLEGYSLDFLFEINKNVLKPDVSIYLDVPPEIAIERIEKMEEEKKIYEEKEILKKVYCLFEKTMKFLEEIGFDKFFRIDGTKSPDGVFEEARRIIKDLL